MKTEKDLMIRYIAVSRTLDEGVATLYEKGLLQGQMQAINWALDKEL